MTADRFRFFAFVVLISLGVMLGSLACAQDAAPQNTNSPNASYGMPQLYLGGVAGVEALLDPANTAALRQEGIGLYLHNTGWMKFDVPKQEQVLSIFRGLPLAIELGFGDGGKWGDVYEKHYGAFHMQPVFIAINAFSSNRHLTMAMWNDYVTKLRQHGVPPATLLLPTFEYQNFGANKATLAQNMVSKSAFFQSLIKSSGGLVLDTPPRFALAREPAYRDWVMDAIRWTRANGFKAVVIVSPDASGANWPEDTKQYVDDLTAQGALPSSYVCENYSTSKDVDYPNRVGSESNPANVAGLCRMLRQKILAARPMAN